MRRVKTDTMYKCAAMFPCSSYHFVLYFYDWPSNEWRILALY